MQENGPDGRDTGGRHESPLIPEGVPALLRRPLFLTRLGMIAERATTAFWPLWSWLFLIWTVLSFDFINRLSVESAYVLALAAAAGVLGFLVHGLRSFRWPSLEEALDRLDRSLEGRPLSALGDDLAIGGKDPAARAVWQAHLERMAARLAQARAVRPDLRLSTRDPWGLRYLAATGLVVALIFGSIRLTAPGGAPILAGKGKTIAAGPSFEGWIQPPRYTGMPVIYINKAPTDAPLPVPQGSIVTLRLYGAEGAVSYSENVSDPAGKAAPDKTDAGHVFKVVRSGQLTIRAPGTRQSWQIRMIPDQPPMVAITGPIEADGSGAMTLTFSASDDYGVVGGTVTIRLDLPEVERRHGLALPPEPRPEIVLDLPMPFRGDRKQFTDKLVEDLSQSPWAGLPVTLTVQAVDARGQKALAEPEALILPGRRFFTPLAAAVAEQRRDLLWNRKNARRVAQVLRAVSYRPEDVFDNMSAYLVLRSAIRRLEFNMNPVLPAATRDEVAEMLWHVATLIEDGDLSDAEKRLKRAQERLSEALRKGASDQEIARLTDELARAMQDYLDKMARNGKQDQQQAQGETREITADQLRQMLDRIQELFKQGRRAEAQALLQQFNAIMRNIQSARRGGKGEGRGQQALRGLGDTLRQQQRLSDEAFRRLQREFNGGEPGQQGQGETPGPGELAKRQQALRNLLNDQRKNPPAGGTEEGKAAREALRRAEREMGKAEQSLKNGDLPKALDDQAAALEALREGLLNLGRDLARRQGQPGQNGQAGANGPPRDPLGRPMGRDGRIGRDRALSLEESPWRRSQELMREIRRRSGETRRPRYERDYLKRLLDRF